MSKREATRWQRRERKYRRRRYGMQVDGRSVRDILLPLIGRGAKRTRKIRGRRRPR